MNQNELVITSTTPIPNPVIYNTCHQFPTTMTTTQEPGCKTTFHHIKPLHINELVITPPKLMTPAWTKRDLSSALTYDNMMTTLPNAQNSEQNQNRH